MFPYSECDIFSVSNIVQANFQFIFDEKFCISVKSQSLNVKTFIYNGVLFVDLGFSHFCLLRLPKQLHVRCFKKSIRGFSLSPELLCRIFNTLPRLKQFSVYKNKGFNWTNRVKYITAKIGKKQQI